MAIGAGQSVSWELAEDIEKVLSELGQKLSPFDRRLLNLIQFACLYLTDMAILLELSDMARAERKKRLFARLIALHVFECFDRFGEMLHQTFAARVRQLATHEQFGPVLKELRKLRKAHAPLLRNMRNSVIAHRDPDASVQLAMIRSIDPKRIHRMGVDVVKWLTSLITALKPFVQEARSRATGT